MRISVTVWLATLASCSVALGAPLRSKPRTHSVAADADGTASDAKETHHARKKLNSKSELGVHQHRLRSAHEVVTTLHMKVKSHPEAAEVQSQPNGESGNTDLRHWEFRCYIPLVLLLAAVASWSLCKYAGFNSRSARASFVETESGAMDTYQFLSVSAVFLALVIGNDFAVSSASAIGGGNLPVHPACIVFLSELAKALVTLLIWLGKRCPIDDKQDATMQQHSGDSFNTVFSTVGLMMIPATIYTLNNMLSLFALAHIHIAHIAVLRPTGVAVFNCLLWLAVFGQKSSTAGSLGLTQKGFGIALCLSGSLLNSVDFREGSLVLAPQAALMLLASTFLSAFGAVANEFVLKYRMQMNIDFQNLCLYFMTVSLSLGVLLSTSQTGELRKIWNCPEVRVIVCYNAVMGLAVSRVLKHMGSLSKMVLGIVREPFEVVVAPLFVISELTPAVVASTLLTVAGGLLYFLPPGALQRTSTSNVK